MAFPEDGGQLLRDGSGLEPAVVAGLVAWPYVAIGGAHGGAQRQG